VELLLLHPKKEKKDLPYHQTNYMVNKAIMGPSTQQIVFSSSDVIATTCFGHTTIIKWHTVVYCLKLLA
jgi:hypothetical protein